MPQEIIIAILSSSATAAVVTGIFQIFTRILSRHEGRKLKITRDEKGTSLEVEGHSNEQEIALMGKLFPELSVASDEPKALEVSTQAYLLVEEWKKEEPALEAHLSHVKRDQEQIVELITVEHSKTDLCEAIMDNGDRCPNQANEGGRCNEHKLQIFEQMEQ